MLSTVGTWRLHPLFIICSKVCVEVNGIYCFACFCDVIESRKYHGIVTPVVWTNATWSELPPLSVSVCLNSCCSETRSWINNSSCTDAEELYVNATHLSINQQELPRVITPVKCVRVCVCLGARGLHTSLYNCIVENMMCGRGICICSSSRSPSSPRQLSTTSQTSTSASTGTHDTGPLSGGLHQEQLHTRSVFYSLLHFPKHQHSYNNHILMPTPFTMLMFHGLQFY